MCSSEWLVIGRFAMFFCLIVKKNNDNDMGTFLCQSFVINTNLSKGVCENLVVGGTLWMKHATYADQMDQLTLV